MPDEDKNFGFHYHVKTIYTEIFGNFLPEISVQLNGSLFENSAIPDFLETCAKEWNTLDASFKGINSLLFKQNIKSYIF